MTAPELLALLPAFEAATGRRAAEAVVSRLGQGHSLVEVVERTLDERARRRSAFAAAASAAAAHQAATGVAPDGRTRRAIASGRLDREALAERVAREVGR